VGKDGRDLLGVVEAEGMVRWRGAGYKGAVLWGA